MSERTALTRPGWPTLERQIWMGLALLCVALGWVAWLEIQQAAAVREITESLRTTRAETGQAIAGEATLRQFEVQGARASLAAVVFFLGCVGVVVIATLDAIRENLKRRDAESAFDELFGVAPFGLALADRAGVIVRANERLAEQAGRPVEALVGQTFDSIFAPADRPTFRRNWDGRLGERWELAHGRSLAIQKPDRTRTPVHIAVAPLPHAGPTLLVTQDLTFQRAAETQVAEQALWLGRQRRAALNVAQDARDSSRRAEEATKRLEETAAELARSNADLEQFAYAASHDLQEPLRAVASCTQLLAQRYRSALDAKANELMQHTVDGVERMRSLIRDLLAYSRVGSRGQELHPVPARAAAVAALTNLATAVAEAKATVHVAELPTVMGDRSQLERLFQNLIGNAIKYRSERTPDIRIDSKRDGEGWQFRVSDNGMGIEREYFERIFGVFQRLHTREEYPGTGIGLALCKRIVERHGGRIWVESVKGEGSTFYFTLPAA